MMLRMLMIINIEFRIMLVAIELGIRYITVIHNIYNNSLTILIYNVYLVYQFLESLINLTITTIVGNTNTRLNTNTKLNYSIELITIKKSRFLIYITILNFIRIIFSSYRSYYKMILLK